MAYKLKHKNLEGVVEGLQNASKMHAKQAGIIERHIKSMEKSGAPSHNPLFGKNKGFKRKDNIFRKFGRFVGRVFNKNKSLSKRGRTPMSEK